MDRKVVSDSYILRQYDCGRDQGMGRCKSYWRLGGWRWCEEPLVESAEVAAQLGVMRPPRVYAYVQQSRDEDV